MPDADQTAPSAGIALGTLLVVVGVAAYVLSGFASVTALVPAVLGAVVVGLGVVGRRTGRGRLSSYGIGALGGLAVLGSLRGIPDIVALLGGESVDSVVAAVSQGLVIVVGLLLVAVVVKDQFERA